MIHVVIDTNIYRQNPGRNNLGFSAIEKMAKVGLIKLHIPYMIEREFQAQQRKIYSDDLVKISSGLTGLSRKQLSQSISERINLIKAEFDREAEGILADAEDQFVQWAESIGARRYPLCLEQAQNALEAYFKGQPPLKSVKVRDDIPDSFVVQAIYKLLAENGELYLIVEDKKIIDTFTSNESIVVYATLQQFIESNLIQNQLKEADLLVNIEMIKQAIQDYETDSSEISQRVSDSIGDQIYAHKIGNDDTSDFENELTIYGWDEPDAEDIKFDFTELTYYGNGYFGLPFTVNMLVMATFYIFKSDYYTMDGHPHVTDFNDHYFEAEEEVHVMINGIASILIDKDNINMEDFKSCIYEEHIGVDEISDIELIQSQQG